MRLFAENHTATEANSALTTFTGFFHELSEQNTLVPSANRMGNKVVETLARSLKYSRNNKGPKLEP